MVDAMTIRSIGLLAGATVAMAVWSAMPAAALTLQECSVKYKAAQAAGTLKGAKWNDFRKAECGANAAVAAPAKATAPAKAAAPGNAVFPSAVSPKYAGESAGKARMHTCLDQYKANKASSGNGGLAWIAKGGGYYSACNKRLSSLSQ